MKKYGFKEKHLQISDPIKSYFESISSCDVKEGTYLSRFVEKLKDYDIRKFYLFCKLVMSVGITFKLINLFLRFNNMFIFLLIPF